VIFYSYFYYLEMSIAANALIEERLSKINYLPFNYSLLKKLKNWLAKSDEEIYGMKFITTSVGSKVKITDVNDQPFIMQVNGVCLGTILHVFNPSESTIRNIQKIKAINNIDGDYSLFDSIYVSPSMFVKIGEITGTLEFYCRCEPFLGEKFFTFNLRFV
jgi:hypothetical protein